MDIKELNVNVQQHTNRNHPWEYARAKVVCNLLKNKLPKKICVVDVGCGDVFFLSQFCDKFPVRKAVAVDTAFTDEVVAQLKQKKNDVQYYNSIEQVDLQGKKADVVFLMDVIEHIEDDVNFLKTLSRKDFVGDETLFMITVPAFNNLYCAHDKWLGHYRRYSQNLLKNHIQQADMSVKKGGYFFTSLLIPRLFQKLLESLKEKEQEVVGIGGWNGGKFVSKLYEIILLCDYYFFRLFRIIGIKMPGLSTYAICKR